jgi:hypothetical protein
LLLEMVQHFFGVTNDQMKSGGRVVVMEANEILGTKISRHSCAGRQSQSPIDFPGPIQLPPNLFEFDSVRTCRAFVRLLGPFLLRIPCSRRSGLGDIFGGKRRGSTPSK